jgi:3-hydroxy-9,10-secoandrosta-1,3,5(10)-triene-9,17-dione monooxygenase reductase component
MPSADDPGLRPPEGMTPDAAREWPASALIDQFLGDMDFHFRLGEDTPLPSDDPEAVRAARHFRDVLGRFATGVTVVTSTSQGEPVGMTCQSFCSVSLSPPLVLFCPAKASRAWPLMRQAGFFCVNLLAADQAPLSDRMASKGADKYDGVGWSPSKTGAPLLDGVLGYIDCTIERVHEAGDHYIVVGRVQELGFGAEDTADPGDQAAPLTFYRGRYGTHLER